MLEGSPVVSVVLPVYNGAEHLRAAIESVLAQDFADIELVVVDDASTDGSLAVAESFADPRITIVALPRNGGLAAALNHGIERARGTLIARQDQDDVSAPTRLSTQVALLAREPETVLVGTWATIVRQRPDGEWVIVGRHQHPTADERLRFRLLWNNPFVHSSVVFRRSAFDSAGGYGTDPEESFPEDYDLWSRLARFGRLANVPEELVTYRESPGAMTKASADRVQAGVLRIACRSLAAATSTDAHDPQVITLARTLNGLPSPPVSLGQAARRVSLFERAASCACPRVSPRLLVDRARWSGKVLVRSLRPARA
ncbi:MAG: glycosyltransferase family 2 protein [Candidatus Nanopelagicales bacterium]